MKNKFISIIWGYHEQIFSFRKNQNYHMMPLEVMTREGYECEIFALDSKVKIEEDPNFIIGTKVIYYKNMGQYLLYLFKNRECIMYSNSLTLKSLLVGVISQRSVFYPHAYLFGSSRLKKMVICFFYRFFSKIRVNNDKEKKELDALVGDKGVIIPLPISPYFYEESHSRVKKKEGIFIGNLTAIKNPFFVLESLTLLSQKNIDFRVHFIGEDRINFCDEVEQRGLQKMVKLHGYVQPKQIKAILESTSIFINTSESEGQCLAAYEAALMGNFLLLPDILSFRPVFGDNALYHNTPGELAENIEKYLCQGPRSNIIEKNQKMVLKNYSYEKLYQELKELFLKI